MTMEKTHMSLSQAVMEAARAAGGEETHETHGLVTYLKAQALATPGSFLTLLGRVATRQETGDVLPITRIELVAPQARDAQTGSPERTSKTIRQDGDEQ